MSSYLVNQFLIAMPAMDDPNFAQTVTLVCEHSERGALGIVINRTLPMTLVEVFDQLGLDSTRSTVSADAVLQGGPMPIAMVRARLANVTLTRDGAAPWRFADELPAPRPFPVK